jgi:ATP-dependent DNA helicase RecQ
VSDEVTVERLREVADELFGLDKLRPAQVEAAAAVLDGRDVLLVLPTGAGKSPPSSSRAGWSTCSSARASS